MSSGKVDVEKYNGVMDYKLWKEKLLAHLEIMGLMEALVSEEAELDSGSSGLVKNGDSKIESSEDTDQKTIATDKSILDKRKKVRGIVVLSVIDDILRKVIHHDTAAAMLRGLDALYMASTLPHRVFLKQKLYGFKWTESKSLEGNVDDFLKIITDLGNIKVKIADEDQAILLLMALPRQFDPLKDTLRYMNMKSTLTLDEVIGAVNSKQLDIVNGVKPSKSHAEVLYSAPKERRARSLSKPADKSKRRSKPRSQSVEQTSECWICGGVGHFMRKCPKKGQHRTDGDKKINKDPQRSDFVESLTVMESNMSEEANISEKWILDTGCTFHMTSRRQWFETLDECSGGSVRMANQSTSEVKGIGTVRIKTDDGRSVRITNVRYIPDFSRNLISLGTFESLGCSFSSGNGEMKVLKGSSVVLKGRREGSLYFLQGKTDTGEVNTASQIDETALWHSRLGHISNASLEKLSKKGCFKSENVTSIEFCEDCVYGKTHRTKFPKGKHSSEMCLEYVHSDLWGSPSVPESFGKCHYFMSLIDDKSRKVWIYFLKTKDQALEKFIEWKAEVENQSGLKVKTLRTDNGLEFCNNGL